MGVQGERSGSSTQEQDVTNTWCDRDGCAIVLLLADLFHSAETISFLLGFC